MREIERSRQNEVLIINADRQGGASNNRLV